MVAVSCGDGTSPARTSFTVWVLDEPTALDGAEAPLPNVRVAFDLPDGRRIEKRTASDGHVTVEDVIGEAGVSVTVLSDDHVYVTMLEASPQAARARPNLSGKPESDLVIFPPRLDPVAERHTVSLRGAISGKRNVDDEITLSASSLVRLGRASTTEPSYVLRAPRDRPFFLLGHQRSLIAGTQQRELSKSFRIDLPARSGDELLDLDVGKLPALPTTTIRIRAEGVPGGAVPFGDGTQASAAVASADSQVETGLFARATPAAGGFDLDVAIVTTDVAPERLLSKVVLTAPDGSKSARVEQGPMESGKVWNEFLPPPTIAQPEQSRIARDPISLDGFPTGADLVAEVFAGGSLLWILEGPPGGPRGKTFSIPYRDEVNVPLVAVFALSLSARKERVALPRRGAFYRYTSTYRDILLRKI